MRHSRRLVIAGLGAVLAHTAMDRADAAGAAPDYPTHTVRIIVPFPAGGGADVVARAIGQQLSEGLGRSVIVENVVGAGGTIARPGRRRLHPTGTPCS